MADEITTRPTISSRVSLGIRNDVIRGWTARGQRWGGVHYRPRFPPCAECFLISEGQIRVPMEWTELRVCLVHAKIKSLVKIKTM